MTVTIVAVSDTHCREWDEVHPDIRRALAAADIAVHCGDFTHPAVVEGMRRVAENAVVVHGNSDPPELRKAIPYVEVLEVGGKRIGVTHPAWGGPEFELEELLPDFPDPVDAIVFGHLHEPVNETRDGVLFVNPGQGYSSFMVAATIAVLTVAGDVISAQIRVIEPAG
ncbi:MAG: metallophosphoesterase family protein [Chloroflexi bacterium]|nr:metallophosphoesterase family protein [Chloroflexota bacterium]